MSVLMALLVVIFLLFITEEDKYNQYMSVTVTREDLSNKISGLTTSVFEVQLNHETVQSIKEVYSFPYTAQYPLAHYDKTNSKVYFIGKDNLSKSDQLFEYDMRKKIISQCTEFLYAINDILLLKDNQLFLTGISIGAKSMAVQPFLYNTRTRKLENISWDEDFDIRWLYENSQGDIYLVGHSKQQQYNHLENQKDGYKPVDSYLIRYRNRSFEPLYHLPSTEILGFYIDEDEFHFMNETGFKPSCINLKTKVSCSSNPRFNQSATFVESENALYTYKDHTIIRIELEYPYKETQIFKNPYNLSKSKINNYWFHD